MNRLQKKCFLGSVTLHALLLTILIVGPGFLRSRTQPGDNLPVLDVIPSREIDAAFFGGGSARPAAPQSTPAQPALSPPPAPPPAAPKETAPKQVESPAPKPRPTPPRDESWSLPEKKSKKQTKPEDTSSEKKTNDKAANGKHEIVPNLARTVRSPTETPSKNARNAGVEGGRGNAEARQAAVAGVVSELRGGLAGATDVGVGGGGPAYASYWQALKTIYTEAWNPPDNLTDDTAKVRAEITIARNGRVISAGIASGGKSGLPSLDRSVQEVLERVRDVPPFPEESKDNERTFKLLFDPKLKRPLG
jgi:TonB family protein